MVMVMVMKLCVMGMPGCDAAVPSHEREALVDLYDSTNGAGWSRNDNWLNGDPCDNNWFGVTCDDTKSYVTQL